MIDEQDPASPSSGEPEKIPWNMFNDGLDPKQDQGREELTRDQAVVDFFQSKNPELLDYMLQQQGESALYNAILNNTPTDAELVVGPMDTGRTGQARRLLAEYRASLKK